MVTDEGNTPNITQMVAARDFYELMVKTSSVTGTEMMTAAAVSFIATVLAEMKMPDGLLKKAVAAIGKDILTGVADYNKHKKVSLN